MIDSKTLRCILITAAAGLLVGSLPGIADAGRGGSARRIQAAIDSGSRNAIVAELERAERLICGSGCIRPVLQLLDDERYEVREVAAWWFARRPAQKRELTERSTAQLLSGDVAVVRNAADILGTFRHPAAVPALATAAARTDIAAPARLHAVRALGTIGHPSANPAIEVAMGDADAAVRLEALTSWLNIRGQAQAQPVVGLVADSDVRVRRKAVAVVGSLRQASARVSLEILVTTDSDASVRRNAAWALGQLGDSASREVLVAASTDTSGLVRRTAKAALRRLR